MCELVTVVYCCECNVETARFLPRLEECEASEEEKECIKKAVERKEVNDCTHCEKCDLADFDSES